MTWGMVAVAGASIIGGVASNKANKKAGKLQAQSSDAAIAATQQAAEEARADVNRIIPQAQAIADQGFQGALNVFGQSSPAQMDVFQQGNLGAQQQLLAGLPQIQNAILGGNVDLSGLQPFQVQQPDLGFLQQTLPQPAPTDNQAQLFQDAASMGPFQAINTAQPSTGGNRGGGGGIFNNLQVRR